MHSIDRLLVPPTGPNLLTVSLAQQGYAAVPMYRTPKTGWFVVRATVGTQSVRLIVDTGARCIDDRLAVEIKSDFADVLSDSIPLTLGSVALGPVNVTSEQYLDDTLGEEVGGVVCIGLLEQYRSRLDFAAGTLYLRLS